MVCPRPKRRLDSGGTVTPSDAICARFAGTSLHFACIFLELHAAVISMGPRSAGDEAAARRYISAS
jgi:hypothetical protein